MLEHAYLRLISGQSRGPLAAAARGLLSAAEIPYRAAMRLRNRRYDRNPPALDDPPAISVGNITAGGTGKTPVVRWLADQLLRAGQCPAILMRGYTKSGSTTSDEATMLHTLLPYVPVIADPDRLAGSNTAMVQQPNTTCFILDDGFQHRRFARDFDLVLINANEPFGFGHVHPRGLLREPLEGLKRASAILITHASEVSPEKLLQTQETIGQYTAAPIFHCDHVNGEIISHDGQMREINDLALIPFYFFTGIGQPQSVVRSLKRYSSYKGERLFDDHHQYTASDVEALCAASTETGASALLTTEKDWVKLKECWTQPTKRPALYRLRLQIRFWENEEELLIRLISQSLRKPG